MSRRWPGLDALSRLSPGRLDNDNDWSMIKPPFEISGSPFKRESLIGRAGGGPLR